MFIHIPAAVDVEHLLMYTSIHTHTHTHTHTSYICICVQLHTCTSCCTTTSDTYIHIQAYNGTTSDIFTYLQQKLRNNF